MATSGAALTVRLVVGPLRRVSQLRILQRTLSRGLKRHEHRLIEQHLNLVARTDGSGHARSIQFEAFRKLCK
jgi:hypothetical protein